MTIPPYAAWVVASLTAGRDPDLTARPVLEPWGRWVDRLRAAPAAERAGLWQSWLLAPNFEAEAITRAIADVDPDEPPPGPDNLLPAAEDVITVCLADVEPQPVEWLWPDRVPLGKITLLAGEAKLGKSFLTMDFIARVSAGLEVPGEAGECMPRGSIILLSAEDDPADTIVPRLIACGADRRKIHILTTIRLAGGTLTAFNLSYVPHLERAITRFVDTVLVVIDPVPHYVGNGTDDHKNAQTRQLLEPLKELAARLRIAVVLVTHLNKGTGTKALNRVTGSGAYTALARSNWFVCKDKDDPRRRLFLSGGTNLVEDPPGLAYRIGRESRRVEWESEPVLMTADEALAASNEAARGESEPSKARKAEEWLLSQVVDGKPLNSNDIHERGEAAGHKRNALFNAKDKLGIRAEKSKEHNGAWLWHPPGISNPSTLQPFNPSDEDDPSQTTESF